MVASIRLRFQQAVEEATTAEVEGLQRGHPTTAVAVAEALAM
jgi:hypothetical protein